MQTDSGAALLDGHAGRSIRAGRKVVATSVRIERSTTVYTPEDSPVGCRSQASARRFAIVSQ